MIGRLWRRLVRRVLGIRPYDPARDPLLREVAEATETIKRLRAGNVFEADLFPPGWRWDRWEREGEKRQ